MAAVLLEKEEESRALALKEEIAELESRQTEVALRIRSSRPMPMRQAPQRSISYSNITPSASGSYGPPHPPSIPRGRSFQRPTPGSAQSGLAHSAQGIPGGHGAYGAQGVVRHEEETGGDGSGAAQGKKRRLLSAVAVTENYNENDFENGVGTGAGSTEAEERNRGEGEIHSGAKRSFRTASMIVVANPNGQLVGPSSLASAVGQSGARTEAEEEVVPPRPVGTSDPNLRKRNRKMFGALLLGTLERFKEEDARLQDSDAFSRRSMMLRRAEEKAVQEREALRQKERERHLEEKRQNLILQARLKAKAEEKESELLLLGWRKHHLMLASFYKTKAHPQIYFCPVKDSEKTQHLKHEQAQDLEAWYEMRREEVKQFAEENLKRHLEAVQSKLPQLQPQPLNQDDNGDTTLSKEGRSVSIEESLINRTGHAVNAVVHHTGQGEETAEEAVNDVEMLKNDPHGHLAAAPERSELGQEGQEQQRSPKVEAHSDDESEEEAALEHADRGSEDLSAVAVQKEEERSEYEEYRNTGMVTKRDPGSTEKRRNSSGRSPGSKPRVKEEASDKRS